VIVVIMDRCIHLSYTTVYTNFRAKVVIYEKVKYEVHKSFETLTKFFSVVY